MKIMVNYPNKKHEVAGDIETAFIEEFAGVCERDGVECRLVGKDMRDYVPGWTFKEYHRNYFRNELDWMLGYYHLFPDWLTRPPLKARPAGFTGKIAEWGYDIHVEPEGLVAEANANIDLWLMRSTEAPSILFPTRAQWFDCKGDTPDEWVANGCAIRAEPDHLKKRITTNYMLFPISLNPEFFHPIAEKDHDIAMVGIMTPYYPLRRAIFSEIKKFATDHKLRLLLHPSPPNECTANIELVLQNPALRRQYSVGRDYAERIAKSKMFVFCSGFMHGPLGKYFEGMMAGTAVVADTPVNASELHFEPDRNFININMSNWKEKILYYLDDNQAREEIAQRGRETAVKYHTNEVRAKELLSRMKALGTGQ